MGGACCPAWRRQYLDERTRGEGGREDGGERGGGVERTGKRGFGVRTGGRGIGVDRVLPTTGRSADCVCVVHHTQSGEMKRPRLGAVRCGAGTEAIRMASYERRLQTYVHACTHTFRRFFYLFVLKARADKEQASLEQVKKCCIAWIGECFRSCTHVEAITCTRSILLYISIQYLRPRGHIKGGGGGKMPSFTTKTSHDTRCAHNLDTRGFRLRNQREGLFFFPSPFFFSSSHTRAWAEGRKMALSAPKTNRFRSSGRSMHAITHARTRQKIAATIFFFPFCVRKAHLGEPRVWCDFHPDSPINDGRARG